MFLLKRFGEHQNRQCLIVGQSVYSYRDILEGIGNKKILLKDTKKGSVVLLPGDFDFNTICWLFALWESEMIAVPFSQGDQQKQYILEVSQAEAIIDANAVVSTGRKSNHPLYSQLRSRHNPGLVLFSSATTGPGKGIVHDVSQLTSKYQKVSPRFQRILAFLILDHLGGIDTLLYTLANCGCLIVPHDRSPRAVLEAIQEHKVEMLPTSPSFLNLILMNHAYQNYDLSSLCKISYGAERMPEITLQRFHRLFPKIKMTQTYGISEIGVLQSVSQASDSLWMQVGGPGYQTRVIDGMLQVRSPYMMLGYLNAPSVVTEDGWFITGDLVEQKEAYIRIKGRANEVINVGGEKVNPIEVEEVIRELPHIEDVLVYGEENPILGQIVAAKVISDDKEVSKIRAHCLARLPKYKVPIRIEFVDVIPTSDRGKRKRTF
jgi:long-chain acyl-CoA synthetase